MSFAGFKAAQTEVDNYFAQSPVFESLIPLVVRMFSCVRDLAQPRFSPTMGRLLMLCHREFLVAATLIQRGLPYDAAANTRRAIEIAKVALLLKRDPANGEKWMQAEQRRARWDARQAGDRPKPLRPDRFPEISDDPLYKCLQDFLGMYSDVFVHFTPEFMGIQHFREALDADNITLITLQPFAPEHTILQHGITLCGLHVRILALFDACFDNVLSNDKGWQMLKATFDQLGSDLLKTLPTNEDSAT
jgi:hypothetical protein